ncbi:transporter, NhaC family [Ekhidna lutea]|uniref:Transporter, NhaC family n=1 Tax=Ekhidna lutea TaxID=447679 RepID=A0A239H6G4_EKHLU|nr:Na+/H+ antiporter NhaC family protein [Ekhidna lutea]SNS76608.1 transporter, NhaC family [Ekhidna lutea]
MTDYGFWSLIPPLLAIGLAIRTKQVVFSLSLGIFVGYLIIQKGNLFEGFLSTITAFVDVFQSKGNTRTIVLTLIIGALIQLIKYSGGINGFINWVQKRLAGQSNFKGKVQATSALTGFLIFVESNISILTVGTIFRPLFDKHKIPREKLAYLADSSSAPSCVLFPLNAWGAYVMGLLLAFPEVDPFQTLIYSIPFNFYAILTLGFVFWLALSGKEFGEMKKFAERKQPQHEHNDNTEDRTSSPLNMVVPIATMVLTMPFFLIYGGWDAGLEGGFTDKIWNSISNGSGSEAVLNACFAGFLTAAIMYGFQKMLTIKTFIDQSFKGMNDMVVMAVLMVLAFAIGNLCNELGTGIYVSRVTSAWLIPEVAPALIFIISSFIAFATGTSWGTFAIMISIGVPLSFAVDANLYLVIAAVLGGGVFGDHCSPISDTTLIASVASGCDHIDHVRTQLPYALFTGGLAILCYLIAGFIF